MKDHIDVQKCEDLSHCLRETMDVGRIKLPFSNSASTIVSSSTHCTPGEKSMLALVMRVLHTTMTGDTTLPQVCSE